MNNWDVTKYELYAIYLAFINAFFDHPQKTKRKRKAKRKELWQPIVNPTPSIYDRKSIRSARPGESGYVVGWAIHFDMQSQSWYINGAYFLCRDRGGTADIEVYVNQFCNIEVHGIGAIAEYLARYTVDIAVGEGYGSLFAQRSAHTNFDNGELTPIANSDDVNRWIASFGSDELNDMLFGVNQL